MGLRVIDAIGILENHFPNYRISWNGDLRAIKINYRDVEFSITWANDNGKKCYCVKKYDRVLGFNPYIVKFVDTFDEVVQFLKTYTDIYGQMYLKLEELEVTLEESSYIKKGENDVILNRNSNARS